MIRNRPRAALVFPLLFALSLSLSACSTDKFLTKKGGSAHKWSLARDGDNHYLSAAAKKSNPTAGFILLKRDLWPPFRWEATIGFFGKDGPAEGETGTFGTELDASQASPLQFYGISAQPVGGGLNAFAASHLSAPGTHGAKFFAGARRLDVVIEHNGTQILFLVRESLGTGGAYHEIARITPGAAYPVQPGAGAAFIRKPTKVGFDNFRIVRNGNPPAPNPAVLAAQAIYGAVDTQMDALHDLDGPAPDRGDVQARLEASVPMLDGAIAKVNALAEPSKGKKPKTGPAAAAKLLKKARKKLLSAIKKLDKGKAAKSVVKGVLKALRPELEAADALR